MKIRDIISEDTTAGAVAAVAMPMTPGTKPAEAKASVYGKSKRKKKQSGSPKLIRR